MAILTVIYHNLQPKNSIRNGPNMTKSKIWYSFYSIF